MNCSLGMWVWYIKMRSRKSCIGLSLCIQKYDIDPPVLVCLVLYRECMWLSYDSCPLILISLGFTRANRDNNKGKITTLMRKCKVFLNWYLVVLCITRRTNQSSQNPQPAVTDLRKHAIKPSPSASFVFPKSLTCILVNTLKDLIIHFIRSRGLNFRQHKEFLLTKLMGLVYFNFTHAA